MTMHSLAQTFLGDILHYELLIDYVAHAWTVVQMLRATHNLGDWTDWASIEANQLTSFQFAWAAASV